MSLVTSKEMLLKAQREGYAVGAFNVENMEMVQAVIAAAEELKAPVILQTTAGTLKYAEPSMYSAMAAVSTAKTTVPVAMHFVSGGRDSGFHTGDPVNGIGGRCIVRGGERV